MKNNIYINDKLIKEFNQTDQKKYFLLEDNSQIYNIRNLKNYKIQIKCLDCNKLNYIQLITKNHINKSYYCMSCGKLGKRNPFFGKQHSQQLKDKLREERKNKWYTGDKNPMYGISTYQYWIKKYGKDHADILESQRQQKMSIKMSGENNPFFGQSHSNTSIEKMKMANKLYREKLTDIDKEIISKKLSDAQKRCQSNDIIKYRKNKSHAAYISAQSQNKYKMNKIESIIQDELKKRNIDMEYCVILGYHQFDFGNRNSKILLEVQGDYWHANPKIYKKESLNSIQLKKIEKDKLKLVFAQKHGFKIFYIWENDIKNNIFTVLDDIQELIKT